MMKTILAIAVLCTCFSVGFSQDYLLLHNGTEIKVTVVEITTEQVRYKQWGDTSENVRFILKQEVKSINYADGSQSALSNIADTSTDISNVPRNTTTENNMYRTGAADAQRFYKRYKAAGRGTLAVSFFGGVFGLVPAIACSSSPPKLSNLSVLNPKLMENYYYARGYEDTALRIKSRKVWKNFGVGLGMTVLLTVLLVSSSD
jgi:hypothetical protein